jgi:hypothetical protein
MGDGLRLAEMSPVVAAALTEFQQSMVELGINARLRMP